MEETPEAELLELLREVRRIEVQTRRLAAGILSGGYSSVFRGAGIEFDEVRDYAEGDDPRAIDWNVSARMGRPFVKKFVDERELTMLFLLDLSASMSGGFGVWSSRQMAARIAACLAFSAVQNHDKVGLIAFGNRIERYLPPKKGAAAVLRLIRDSLALPQSSGPANFSRALEFAARVQRRRAIVFVLSDFLSPGWRDPLALCSRRHDVVAVRLLPAELAPPRTGLMRIRDAENGETALVDWSSERARAAYAARVDAWKRETAEEIRRAKADRMDVPLPLAPDRNAVLRPILDFFRARELRGMKR